LNRAKDDLVNAEFAFRNIQEKRGVVQPDVQARAVIGSLAALHAQIDARQVELEVLRSYSTDSNPNVQMTQTQLATLRAQAKKLEEKNDPSSIGGLGLQGVAGASLDYLRAEHELLYRQALFDILIKQYDAAKLDEAKQGAIIQVVESGIPPDRRSFPKRTWVMVFFVFLGLAGGSVLALAREAVERDPLLLQPIRELGAALRKK
jgi:capsule polysaccharide export protein KpsE/RkpR